MLVLRTRSRSVLGGSGRAGVVLLAITMGLVTSRGGASDNSQAYSYSTLEKYVKDTENHYAYRQQIVEWSYFSWGGATNTSVDRIGTRGGPSYGYSFSGWNIAIAGDSWNLHRSSVDYDPSFYRDWNNGTTTVNRYDMGWLVGGFTTVDAWCHSASACASFTQAYDWGFGSGHGTCVPYLGTLGGTTFHRHPWNTSYSGC